MFIFFKLFCVAKYLATMYNFNNEDLFVKVTEFNEFNKKCFLNSYGLSIYFLLIFPVNCLLLAFSFTFNYSNYSNFKRMYFTDQRKKLVCKINN